MKNIFVVKIKFLYFFVLIYLSMLLACGQRVNEKEIIKSYDLIISDANILFEKYRESSDIPNSEWPEHIKKLNPKGIYISEKGMYIMLKSFFVLEEGIFILRPCSDFEPKQSEDPSYIRIKDNIFKYKIEG